MVTSSKRIYASTHRGSQHCCIQCPWPCSRPLSTHDSTGDCSQANLVQSLVGSLLLSPGSWCAQGFVNALQEFVSPSLVEVLLSKPADLQSQIPWGFSVPLLDPQVGKSVVGPIIFTIVGELLWYNWSPVCGLPTGQLYSRANDDLLQEDLGHTPRLPALLLPVNLSPRQAAAGPCLHQRSSNTHRQVWQWNNLSDKKKQVTDKHNLDKS